MDCNKYDRRAHWPRPSLRSLERKPNDCLGWLQRHRDINHRWEILPPSRRKPDPYCNGNSYRDIHTYTYSNSYVHAHANGHIHTYCYVYAYRDSNSYLYTYTDSYGYTHSYVYSDSDGNGHANSNG